MDLIIIILIGGVSVGACAGITRYILHNKIYFT